MKNHFQLPNLSFRKKCITYDDVERHVNAHAVTTPPLQHYSLLSIHAGIYRYDGHIDDFSPYQLCGYTEHSDHMNKIRHISLLSLNGRESCALPLIHYGIVRLILNKFYCDIFIDVTGYIQPSDGNDSLKTGRTVRSKLILRRCRVVSLHIFRKHKDNLTIKKYHYASLAY